MGFAHPRKRSRCDGRTSIDRVGEIDGNDRVESPILRAGDVACWFNPNRSVNDNLPYVKEEINKFVKTLAWELAGEVMQEATGAKLAAVGGSAAVKGGTEAVAAASNTFAAFLEWRKYKRLGKFVDDVPNSSGSTKPAWLQRLDEGNAFNEAQAPRYPHSEVYIEKAGGGYYRLDSYNPRTGEIVSRKFTQFGDIQESTGLRYLQELARKYATGSKVAGVPSSDVLAGQRLQSQMILEIPAQAKSIPQAILDEANRLGIILRDVNGKIY